MADDYAETLDYLYGLKRLGTRPGLEVTTALLKALGDPQRTFKAVHVTGSKGKGSVAYLTAQALRGTGRRTGLYTSPHLLSYRERTVVDGAPIPRGAVVEGVGRVRKIAEKLLSQGAIDREPTFFEVTTAVAFDHFRASEVEVAAIEVGLGGRLDCTNVLKAPVCVVTTLELEHTEILGPTIQDIAREKAGILHPGAWAVTGAEPGPGFDELRRQAFHQGVPLWQLGAEVRITRREVDRDGQVLDVSTPLRVHHGIKVPLLGLFQAHNVAVTLAALDLFGRVLGSPIPPETIQQAFAGAHWPGRLERLATEPRFYLDAAHTPESAQALVSSLREVEPEASPEESVLLFSCLEDKRSGEILRTLSEVAATVVLVQLASERAQPVATLARQARGLYQRVLAVPSMAQALALAKLSVGTRGVLLATGGVYLAGEVLSAQTGAVPEGPDLSDALKPSPKAAEVAAKKAPATRPPRRRSRPA